MTVPQATVTALADEEAWRSRGNYPQLSFGGPVFAREREHGGWELLRSMTGLAPHDAGTVWAQTSAGWCRPPRSPATRAGARSACGRRNGWTGRPSTR